MHSTNTQGMILNFLVLVRISGGNQTRNQVQAGVVLPIDGNY